MSAEPSKPIASTATATASNFLHRMGITGAVVYSVLARTWSVIAGPITLICIGRFLTREEQGFYYTVWSVLGLQIVFELGFSFVIAQFASHERANLQSSDGRMGGDPRSLERLASLLQLSVKWYCGAAMFMVGILLPGGVAFFLRYGRGTTVHWMLPWILVAIVTAFNLTLIPLTAVLEGVGKVKDISLMRLLQLMTTNVLLWVSLISGAHLFSAVVLSTSMAVFAVSWLAIRHRVFLLGLWRASVSQHPIVWRREVWPFQWRMAVSWVSSYVIYQLFNPILFAAHGAEAAARMGMSLMVVIAISSFAVAWVNARAVDYGALIASRRFAELDSIFFNSLWQSLTVMVILSSGFVGIVLLLRSIHHPFADRVLDPMPLVLLLLASVVQHIFVAQAAYLRAFKREPYMSLTLLIAAMTIGGSLLVVKRFAAAGITALFLCVIVAGVIGSTAIFLVKRREWREAPATVAGDELVESEPALTSALQ